MRSKHQIANEESDGELPEISIDYQEEHHNMLETASLIELNTKAQVN